MRLKEVKISIHRKYTENFQSYGYRIGIMFDVDKVDNARTCYYSGKAFLNERIAEEDLIIKNLMAKKVAEKSSGYKELGDIPEKKVSRSDLGGVYKELEGREVGKKVVEKGSVKSIGLGGLKGFGSEEGEILKIVSETGLSRVDVVNLVKEKMNELKGLINEKGAVFIVGKELGVVVSEPGKKGVVGGEVVMVPFDVKQIKRTSPKAVLVELFGTKGDLWVPKSCVGDGDAMDLMQKGVKSQLFIASWFLEKSGLM